MLFSKTHFLHALQALMVLSIPRKAMGLFAVLGLLGLLSSCAYRWGHSNRGIPGGYRQVHVPMFKNYSMEPGIEALFTSAMIQEIERAKVAKVTDLTEAEVILEGEITDVSFTGENLSSSGPTLGFSQAQQYLVSANVRLVLKRASDRKVLSSSTWNRKRTYLAPRVTQPGLNSVNPLYNQSARRQNLEIVAKAMMSDAHDRMTDNF